MKNVKGNRLISCAIVVVLAALPTSTPVVADIVINATETDGNVVFEGGGTLDITLWNFVGTTPHDSGINTGRFLLIGTGGDIDIYDKAVNFNGPTSIGPGDDGFGADFVTGDKIGISWSASQLVVPTGYISGDQLNGSATFIGLTFDLLGVEEGSYTWTWDTADGRGDFFTLNIIPAPSTIALLGFAGIISRRRRRA